MITELRISNFYSFGDEQTVIQFYKGGKKPENGYYQYKDKKISLIQGFFGANASGKTNVLRAIEALSYWIIIGESSTNTQRVIKNLNEPNYSKTNKNKPIKLGGNFLINNNLYSYDIELTDFLILRETLKTIDIKSGKEEMLFSIEEEGYSFSKSLIDAKSIFGYTKKKTKTALSLLLLIEHPVVKELQTFFNGVSYVSIIDNSNVSDVISYIFNKFNKDEIQEVETNQNSVNLALTFLKLFDDSIINLDFNTDDNKSIKVEIEHRDFYSKVPIAMESRGTQELFSYIVKIINCLKNGGIVVYDEINRYFHPHIQMAIIKLFLDPDLNKNNAQLFFSSHDHQILNELALDQIHIVEKEDGFSTVTKLSQFDNSATRDNITKKYSLGVFGGVPDIIDFKHGLRQVL